MQVDLQDQYSKVYNGSIGQPKAAQKPLVFDEQMDIGRFIVEVMLYLSIICRAFAEPLGILRFQGLSGAIITLSGMTCLMIMMMKRQKLPVSVYFAFAINVTANISQVLAVGQPPIFGDFLRALLFWMYHLLMMCYIVRNNKASYRAAFVLGLMAIIAVVTSGEITITGTVSTRVERLELQGLGSMFANANDLAYLVAILSIVLLFFSLRCSKVFKIFFWLLALILAVILFKTISRGATFFYVISIFTFLLATVLGRGGKLSLFLIILLALFAMSRFAYQTTELKEAYRTRVYRHSERMDTWKAMPYDIKNTLIFGRGPSRARTLHGTGVSPHNTFFWLHLAYGGICAWVYLWWIGLLCLRGRRMLFSRELAFRQKLEVVGIFSMAMGCQILANFGPSNYAVVFAMAIVDKFTSPFSKKQIVHRNSIASQL